MSGAVVVSLLSVAVLTCFADCADAAYADSTALGMGAGTAQGLESLDVHPQATRATHDSQEQIIIVTGAGLLAPTATIASLPIIIVAPRRGLGERVENILRDAAVVTQFRRSDSRSAHPTSQGISARGLGGNAASRMIVLLDGVPQADPFGGWVAWSAYDSVRLGAIHISYGGGGAAQGPGALAGVVALYSQLSSGGAAGVAYGARNALDIFGSVGGELGAGGGVGSGRFSFDMRYAHGDGFLPIASDQRGKIDRAAPYRQAGAGLRTIFDIGADSRIETSLRGFIDRRDRGVDFTHSAIGGFDANIRFIHDPTSDLAGGMNDQWLGLFYIQLREFESGFAAVTVDRNSVRPVLAQAIPAIGLGARLEWRPDIGGRDIGDVGGGGNHPLHIGVDWRRTTAQTRENYFFTKLEPQRQRRAGGHSDVVGAFVAWSSAPGGTVAGDRDQSLDQKHKTSAMIWSASARLDHWRIGKGTRIERDIGGALLSDSRFAARSDWQASGRLEATWHRDGVTLRTAAYRQWRLPTLNELYRPFRIGANATAANESLRPETLWGGDIGIAWQRGDSTIAATLFVNRLDGAIANVTLSSGGGLFPGVGFVSASGSYAQRRNLDAIISKGIEIRLQQKFGLFDVRASYVFVDSTIRASGDATVLNGLSPPQIARHQASTEVQFNRDFRMGSLAGTATMRYAGGRNEDDLGLRRLAGAFTADLRLAWRLSQTLRLEGRVANFFNRRVPVSISSSGIVEQGSPRSFWLGLAADW